MKDIPLPNPPISAIRFRASWPEPGSYGLIKAREVEFKMGLGPCGRVVTHLAYTVSGELLTIKQTSYPPELADSRWLEERKFKASLPQDIITGGEIIPVNLGLFGFRKSFLRSPVEIQRAEISESSKKILKEFEEHRKARRDACEIKTFIYKMSDVHGRIVTEQ
uniref:Uncharacterized protein n=1 Tax=Pseudomonas phage Ghuch01 TaxID=3138535 RepID=A0AAU6W306_9CAUD